MEIIIVSAVGSVLLIVAAALAATLAAILFKKHSKSSACYFGFNILQLAVRNFNVTLLFF